MNIPIEKTKTNWALILSGLLICFVGFGWYKYHALSKEYTSVKTDLSTKVATLEKQVSQDTLEKTSLNDALSAEKTKNDAFQAQIDAISGTVGTLQKLKTIDPELLKKYSKVYFLNEHYVPSKLVQISPSYIFDPKKDEYIQAQVAPFLKSLMDAANSYRHNLKVLSAYRSFDTQTTLKSGYKVVYGAGTANQFSAEQGYSEHQLGSAVDFTNPVIGSPLTGFEKTDEYTWLTENAYKYGFILSYPQGNNYYQFEPWHWRFVGVSLAQKLHNSHMNFYDMDQREIDTYLLSLFD